MKILAILDVAQTLDVCPAVTVLASRLPALMLATESRGVAALGEADVVLRELRKREIMDTGEHGCE